MKTKELSYYLELYKKPLAELIKLANEIKRKYRNDNLVTYIVERNINYTNVCKIRCRFCNFSVTENSKNKFILNIPQILKKVEELVKIGGTQVLIQGGISNDFGLNFFIQLFKEIKRNFNNIRIHSLSPPEIVHLAKLENKSIEYILTKLKESGLDSLPGGGAEILSDRVRKILSPNKCTVEEWAEVMKTAHKLNIPTTATMVYGHIETLKERIQHLLLIKKLQDEKPSNSYGFLSFILWPYISGNNSSRMFNIKTNIDINEYIRLIAFSRIVLNNIPHIQPSLITVGKEIAQLSLHCGADDLGSLMIEEKVISSSNENIKTIILEEEMKKIIKESGFIPAKRDGLFNIISISK